MQPPRFWNNPPKRPGIWAYLLSPLSMIWRAKTATRLSKGPRHKLDIPVIAVGNINLGGTGKTPSVIALVQMLQDMGRNPAVVSRGYGGQIQGPHQVDPNRDEAGDTGDEPLLIAAFAAVWVSKDRVAGARAAHAQGHDCVILDDALQNPDLSHDLTITVVDAKAGFGNGRVCPSGPLREPVETGLSRSDLVLSVGTAHQMDQLTQDWPALRARPLIRAVLAPLETGFDWAGMRVYAFAGIGRPAKFFQSLKQAGANLIVTRAFGDHAPYNPALLKRMQAEAWAQDCNLVTTEKDAVRLPQDMRHEVLTFPVRIQFEDETKVREALATLFAKAG